MLKAASEFFPFLFCNSRIIIKLNDIVQCLHIRLDVTFLFQDGMRKEVEVEPLKVIKCILYTVVIKESLYLEGIYKDEYLCSGDVPQTFYGNISDLVKMSNSVTRSQEGTMS